jgi:hypothetical protein
MEKEKEFEPERNDKEKKLRSVYFIKILDLLNNVTSI